MNPTRNLIEPKLYMNLTKNLIESKLYMNPTKNMIEPKLYIRRVVIRVLMDRRTMDL